MYILPAVVDPSSLQHFCDRVVEGIAALFLALKRRPVIRYSRTSDISKRIAQEAAVSKSTDIDELFFNASDCVKTSIIIYSSHSGWFPKNTNNFAMFAYLIKMRNCLMSLEIELFKEFKFLFLLDVAEADVPAGKWSF